MERPTSSACSHPTIRGPCAITAGEGTGHPGVGKCQKHDLSISTLTIRDTYVATAKGDTELAGLLRDMGAELLVDRSQDTSGINLSFELKVLRAMLLKYLQNDADEESDLQVWARAYKDGDIRTPPSRYENAGSRLVDKIAKIADTISKINGSIPKTKFMEIMVAISGVINTHVTDKGTRKAIQRDVYALCGGLL